MRRAAGFLCVLILLVVSCETAPKGAILGDVLAPIAPLPKVGGGRLSESDLRGKVIVLDFWATWCQPCIVSLPHMVRLYKDYNDQGLTIVGVTMQSKLQDVQRLIVDSGINYPLVVGGDDLIPLYGLTGFPTVLVVDRSGATVQTFEGMPPPHELEETIRRLLAQSAS